MNFNYSDDNDESVITDGDKLLEDMVQLRKDIEHLKESPDNSMALGESLQVSSENEEEEQSEMILMQTLEQMTQKMKKEMSDNNDDMTEIFEELSNPLKLDIQELYDVLGTDDVHQLWGCNENIINANIDKQVETVESSPVLTEELVGEILDDIIDEQPIFIDKEISEVGIDIS